MMNVKILASVGIFLAAAFSPQAQAAQGEAAYMNGIRVALVEAGSFDLGKDDGVFRWWSGPSAQHVTLTNDFHIGKYPITNAQYAAFLNENAILADGILDETALVYPNASSGLVFGGGKWSPAAGKANYPVVNVTWFGAFEFARWVGGRLPTEAEWEFAARGGNKSRGYVFSGSDNIDEIAYYSENSGRSTQAVGKKLPNELGIHDMTGNVWEWTNCWFCDYGQNPEVNPSRDRPTGFRTFRGGSFNSAAGGCRIASRNNRQPNFHDENIGFRVAFGPANASLAQADLPQTDSLVADFADADSTVADSLSLTDLAENFEEENAQKKGRKRR